MTELSSTCWISPDGICYPCSPYKHEKEAERICTEILGVNAGSRLLEDMGYLRMSEGMCGSVEYITLEKSPTQAQLNILYNITKQETDEEILQNIEEFLMLVLKR